MKVLCRHLPFRPRRNATRRSGQALVGLLVVTLILLGLYFLFLGPRRDSSGEVRPSVARQSIDRGKQTGGTNYIGQIQVAIQQFRDDNEGRAPASLEELKAYAKGYPPEMWVDPVSGQPLVYDPQTGTIAAPPPNPSNAAPQSTLGGAPIGTAPAALSVPQPAAPQTPAETEP